MSNFWAEKLGTPPPPPPDTTRPQETHRPWWDEPTAHQQRSEPVQQQVQPQPQAEQYQVPRQAMSARSEDFCPGCDGTNYFQPQGHPNSPKRCFECGYPNQQTTSGVTSTGSGQQAIPTRQVSTANNYNPGMIVGRV